MIKRLIRPAAQRIEGLDGGSSGREHLAAILAADVEGYSRLMHGDEETTMATLSALRGIVDELIGRPSRSHREHRRR